MLNFRTALIPAAFILASLAQPGTTDAAIADPVGTVQPVSQPVLPAVVDDRDSSLSVGTDLPRQDAPTPDHIIAQAPEPALADNEPDADATPHRSLAALVARTDSSDDALDSETRCLAVAVFFEARSESLTGKHAVARVVINRAASGRFPSSLCGVVTQPRQFSFVRGGRLPAVDSRLQQWRDSVAIARIALAGDWRNPAEGALFFHARQVSPSWNRQRLAQIENHIFYR